MYPHTYVNISKLYVDMSNAYLISLVGSVFANGPGVWSSIPRLSHTKDLKKWYLIPPCLTLTIVRYVSR